MSVLDAWAEAAKGQPAAVGAVPPPPAPESALLRKRTQLCLSLVVKLRALSVEPGDAADEARDLAQSGLDAMRHNPIHGRNWWDKHSADLRSLVAPFFPDVFPPDAPLTGLALQAELMRLGFHHRTEGVRISVPSPTRADAATRAPARDSEPGQGGLRL